jgi:hypothetical protein
MQIISVKILLFRMIINKSYYAIHSTMQYEVLPHHNKDGPLHNKDGLTHHNKDGFNYPIILNALSNRNYILDTICIK